MVYLLKLLPLEQILWKIHYSLCTMNTFLSEDGVLMVDGRLNHSCLSWSTKCPMILPSKTHFFCLIIDHYHKALLHPGVLLLLVTLQSKFWIQEI